MQLSLPIANRPQRFRRHIMTTVTIIATLITMGHDHAHAHPAHDASAPCICAWSKSRNVWCRHCNVGYVATQRIESAQLFDALDPHGHVLDVNVWECKTCVANYDNDGYCTECRMGCHDGLVYFTRLTYGLSFGRQVNPATISCEHCATLAGDVGWCESCSSGIVGNVVFADRNQFDSTAEEFITLRRAIEKVEECELCACAMVAHSDCPTCYTTYR